MDTLRNTAVIAPQEQPRRWRCGKSACDGGDGDGNGGGDVDGDNSDGDGDGDCDGDDSDGNGDDGAAEEVEVRQIRL
jgi:hypothetical protein